MLQLLLGATSNEQRAIIQHRPVDKQLDTYHAEAAFLSRNRRGKQGQDAEFVENHCWKRLFHLLFPMDAALTRSQIMRL